MAASCYPDSYNPPCEGNLDHDCDVDAQDVTKFLEDFGRGTYDRPCPPSGSAMVEKSGQRTSYDTGDDGDLEKGVPWPNPRFTDNGDGTVSDNLTGLIWLKNANCFGTRIWNNALSDCNGLASGLCGLSDGSSAGEWRLPQIKEIQSLIDFENVSLALPSGHPFLNALSYYYWSSTTYAGYHYIAWAVHMGFGDVRANDKYSVNYYVWPVRGGQ